MPEGITSSYLLAVFGAVVALLLPPSSIFNSEFRQEFVGEQRDLIQAFRGAWILNLVGNLLGILCIVPVANRIGRKGGIIVSNVILQVGLILAASSAPSGSSILLIGGRFCRGLSSGLNAGLIPMYLMEISPERIRGAAGSCYYLALYLSGAIRQMSNFVDDDWPKVMKYLCPFLPGFLQIVIMVLSPESPKFSVIIKKNEIEGERALISLRGIPNVYHELDRMKEAEELRRATCCTLVSDSSLRTPLLISVVAMFAQVCCGFNAVGLVSNGFFYHLDLSRTVNGVLYFGMVVFELLAISASLLVVDKFGRRALLLHGLIGIFVALLSITACAVFAEKAHWFYYLGILFVILFKLLFCLGPGPIPWFLACELFTTGSRAWAAAGVALVHLTGNLVASLSLDTLEGLVGRYVLLFYAALLAPSCLCLWFRLPETKRLKGYPVT